MSQTSINYYLLQYETETGPQEMVLILGRGPWLVLCFFSEIQLSSPDVEP